MNKKYLIGIGVALAVLVGAVISTSSVKADGGGQSTLSDVVQNLKDLKNVLTELQGLSQPVETNDEPSFGSVVGPDSFFPRYSNNGVVTYPVKRSFLTATGTVFATISPAASSTVEFTVSVNVATATAQLIQVATSSNAYATSTPGGLLGSLSLASGTYGTLVGTSTNNNCLFSSAVCTQLVKMDNGYATSTSIRLSEVVIPPNTYVVVKIGAEYGSTDVSANTVRVVFTEI